ncbi:MAG: DNA methyltransferase [Nitrososphaerales archaeon]
MFDFADAKEVEKYLEELRTRVIQKLKKGKTVSVPDIPLYNVPNDSTIFIDSTNVAYCSHGIHEFPAKFIPQIPRWAILKFCKTTDREERDKWVLDPFCGSGTTLVEAKLSGVNAYGIDIDPMARLLTKVKTTYYEKGELESVKSEILSNLYSYEIDDVELPDFPNRDHWFDREVSTSIAIVKKSIEKASSDKDILDFFYVCLSAIIRTVSLADPDQIFPEKTEWGLKKKSKMNKTLVFNKFEQSVNKFLPRILEFSNYCYKDIKTQLIKQDARKLELDRNSIDISITSPPYINAMDYPRVNQLEMYWLGLLDAEKKVDLKKKYVGTEAVSSKDYSELHLFKNTKYHDYNKILQKIYKVDKVRAYIAYKFFDDMKQNFEEVFRVLKKSHGAKKGRYVVVIGDGVIRKIPVPTHEILARIGKDVGFSIENVFSYVIRHRTLLITRAAHSGIIHKDWITVFKKD